MNRFRKEAVEAELRKQRYIVLNDDRFAMSPSCYVKHIVIEASKIDGYVDVDRLLEIETRFLHQYHKSCQDTIYWFPQIVTIHRLPNMTLFTMADEKVPDPVVFCSR